MRPGQLALSLARLLYSRPQSQPHVHRLLVNVMEKTRSSIQTYMYSDLKADLLCLITDREMHCTLHSISVHLCPLPSASPQLFSWAESITRKGD